MNGVLCGLLLLESVSSLLVHVCECACFWHNPFSSAARSQHGQRPGSDRTHWIGNRPKRASPQAVTHTHTQMHAVRMSHQALFQCLGGKSCLSRFRPFGSECLSQKLENRSPMLGYFSDYIPQSPILPLKPEGYSKIS